MSHAANSSSGHMYDNFKHKFSLLVQIGTFFYFTRYGSTLLAFCSRRKKSFLWTALFSKELVFHNVVDKKSNISDEQVGYPKFGF